MAEALNCQILVACQSLPIKNGPRIPRFPVGKTNGNI